MKTAREWFETFPEPYRSQAIANCKYPNDLYESASDALDYDFDWEDSPEGFDYWFLFHRNLLNTNQ